MKALFDTSLLVAGLVEAHPFHDRAFAWLRRARERRLELHISAHSVAELYAVLTVLPVRPRIAPSTARRLVRDNTEAASSVVTLTAADYDRTVERMATLGLGGGAVYDALIARAAEKASVDKLVTFNVADFERVWPEGRSVITPA